MKKKILCIFLLAAVVLFSIPGSLVSALEENSELNESFVYNPYYKAVVSPAAYRHWKVLTAKDFGTETIAPVDVTSNGTYLYVLCGQTNAVYIFNRAYELVQVIREVSGLAPERAAFNAPEGLFAEEDGTLYIADTMNQRILKVDSEGKLIQEYTDPGILMAGKTVNFYPSKLAVDPAGRMYVVGKNINRGLIELSREGEFNSFIGAPKVKADFSDIFRRMFMTKEQIRRMEKFIPTEYNNVTIDASGFIYGTIGSVNADAIHSASFSSPASTADNAKPILKLSPAGEDILLRRGNVPVIGMLDFTLGDQSLIVDVSVRPDGIYSVLDQRHGRIFSYDMYGNLLYVFGALGRQNGRFLSPGSLCYFGEELIVADQIGARLTVFSITQYGEMLNEAVRLDYDGRFEEAAEYWSELVKMNSNLYLAYTGIGKKYYREKDYKNAMQYFKAAYDDYNYDKSKEKIRKEWLTRSFPVLFAGILTATAGLMLYRNRKKWFKKEKRRQKV